MDVVFREYVWTTKTDGTGRVMLSNIATKVSFSNQAQEHAAT
jgi:hypothetical protein